MSPQAGIIGPHQFNITEVTTRSLGSWREEAACRDTDPGVFFLEQSGDSRPAKQICAGCDVREECLDYALANRLNLGVWGGKSAKERQKLRRTARQPD